MLITYRRLDDLKIHPENYRVSDERRIADSIRRFGFNGAFRVWRGVIIAGAHTYKALVLMREEAPDKLPHGIERDEDGMWKAPCVNANHLTEQEAKAFMLADNRLQQIGYDDEEKVAALIAELPADLVDLVGYADLDLQEIMDGLPDSEVQAGEGDALETDDGYIVEPGFVPDVYWPSSNEWGIPDLDPEHQATEIVLPVKKWGSIARSSQMQGTYHFYCEDYKMEGVWGDPSIVVNSRAKAVIECNWSTTQGMPRALVLYHAIYRKRWLARYLQSYGVKIWVDMNVERDFWDIMLLGVPKTWRAFANRAYSNDPGHLEQAYNFALKHTGADKVSYLVYGGGRETQDLCNRKGWLWVPEEADVVRGRYQKEAAGYGPE